jgi:hypothetical protein
MTENTPQPGYDLFRRADLEVLVEMQSKDAPVFSLYLDLNPESRMTKARLTRFKAMLRQAEQRIHPDQRSHAYRKQWIEEANRLQTLIEGQRSLQGKGLAVLSCLSIGLWRAFRLPLPVRDQLEVSDRPYLRPLVVLLDEQKQSEQDQEAERARRLEEKMDEALEESFPASDPPYWMPLARE